MPLEKSKFKFQSHYIGLWNRPDYPDERLSGTLFIEDKRMWIELYFKPSSPEFSEKLELLNGCTSGMDEKGAEYAANISAEGLRYERLSHLENGLWHYRYSVSRIYIYENQLQKDKISSINIRASILDCWCEKYLSSRYECISNDKIPYGHHIIHHTLPYTKMLFRGEKISVTLRFPCTYSVGGINQGVTQRTILSISFSKSYSFDEAMYFVNEILYLFYILTNRIFPIDYLYSESGLNVFIYKANESLLYRYIGWHPGVSPHISLSDFSDDSIKMIFQKWDEFYTTQSDALNSYFENHTNIYTSPSSKIRNYISTIDTLSKEMRGPKGALDLSTNKAKYLLKIIEKYKISNCEANELKSRFLNSSGTELKTRFANLLEKVKEYFSEDLSDDFVTKVVNTRHNIIHPKANMAPCFSPGEYDKVALQLNRIILLYILDVLEVEKSIVDKALKTSGLALTLS